VIFTVIFLLATAVTRDWALLFIVLPCAGAGLFVWAGRHVWRRNADRWRQGYDDVF
jgi:threonine/homoserine/homoserine lactone efflux protein